MNVIFHLNQHDRLRDCVANIKNLSATNRTENIDLLINGEAITLTIKDQNIAIKELMSVPNVTISACNNALRAHNIDSDILENDIKIVPVGVLYLVEKQKQGYAYIKP